MQAYSTAGWENFFVAEVGAAAALTGLIFVAVSINLSKILQFAQLPRRAAESLIMLMTVLVLAGLGLVPGQPRAVLGLEVLGIAFAAWMYPMVLQRRDARLEQVRAAWVAARAILHQLAVLPLLIGGASLLAARGGGLYWMAAGTFLSLAASLANAWILLVEIQR